MAGFQLDQISNKRLVGIHPDLVKLVRDCAAHFGASFSFGISEGLRTIAQQKIDVEKGFSQTMQSRHLDGHAVDLIPLRSDPKTGKPVNSWAWGPFYILAGEMRAASLRTGVPCIWGAVWDVELAKTGSADMEAEATAYIARARAKGERGFADGPHFQLPLGTQYPAGKPIA